MDLTVVAAPLAAGAYVSWGVVQISVTNLVIVGSMLIVFVLAVLVPMPHRGTAVTERRSSRDGQR